MFSSDMGKIIELQGQYIDRVNRNATKLNKQLQFLSGGRLDKGITVCISAPDGLITTGRDHGYEMMDETAVHLKLDPELNPGPGGWKPSALPLS